MSKISIFFGVLLTLLGVLAWVIAGFESPTALIPSFFGLPIAACGKLAAAKPEKSMLFMHIAVVLDVLLLIGAGMRIPKLEEFGSIKSVSIWATAVIAFVLLGLYVQSFIKARTNKSA
jgi:hypothetical protein